MPERRFEALQLLEAHPGISLIFTDVNMPGSMDGVELAHFVREKWPPVKIIVTSGLKDITPEQLPIGLGKPYLPDRLTRYIRSLLDV